MKKVNYGWAAFAILLFLVIIFSMPALKGYNVYKALRDSGVDEEFVGDMAALEEAKAAAEEKVAAAEEAATAAQEASATAVGEASSAEVALEACETQATEDKRLCNELADSLAQEKADVQDKLNDARIALRQLANDHCCVQKVFDSTIVGYDIDGDDVDCTTDGGTQLTC